MRHLFIFTLFCILLILVLAQTTRSLPQPHQAKGPELSSNSASVRDWANRLMAKDPAARYQTPDEVADALKPLTKARPLRRGMITKWVQSRGSHFAATEAFSPISQRHSRH